MCFNAFKNSKKDLPKTLKGKKFANEILSSKSFEYTKIWNQIIKKHIF